MLFRTRRVRKKYFKLKKERRVHFFKGIKRKSLRNWHVFHRLKKIKNHYNNMIASFSSLFDYNKNFLFGKINHIQKTFNENSLLSSEYCLIFQNFIKHNDSIFRYYENFYKEPNRFFSNFDMFGSSTLFFSFFVVKSKVSHIIYIFRIFTDYFIINFESNYCYLVYSIPGEIKMFLLFYFLYLRYIFSSPDFEDLILYDLNYLDFLSILDQYFILTQFYCFMLRHNIGYLDLLSRDISNLEVLDERTISEKSKEEIDHKKLDDDFELEESENKLLSDYIIYDNYDYVNILKDFLMHDLGNDLFDFIILEDNDYLSFSLKILDDFNTLFYNLESLEN